MITGIFNEIVKALVSDADKAFSSGVLGRALNNIAKGPDAPTGVRRAAMGALERPPAGRIGRIPRMDPESLRPPIRAIRDIQGPPPGKPANAVPILKQILGVVQAIATKMGISPRVAGAPSIKERFAGMVQSLGGGTEAAAPAVPGTAKQRFAAMAKQLGGGPIFKGLKTENVTKAAAGSGAGNLAKGILAVGRFAGVVGAVTAGIGIVVAAITSAGAAIHRLVMGVVDDNRELAKYNAKLAQTTIDLEMTRLRLQVQTAQGATGAVGGLVNQEFKDLLEEMQPLVELGGVIKELIAGSAIEWTRLFVWLSKTVVPIEAILAIIEDWFGIIKKNQPEFPLNADLKALQNPGGQFKAPGDRIAPLQPPAFVPPILPPFGNRPVVPRKKK